jgi:hypothetical protein
MSESLKVHCKFENQNFIQVSMPYKNVQLEYYDYETGRFYGIAPTRDDAIKLAHHILEITKQTTL